MKSYSDAKALAQKITKQECDLKPYGCPDILKTMYSFAQEDDSDDDDVKLFGQHENSVNLWPVVGTVATGILITLVARERGKASD